MPTVPLVTTARFVVLVAAILTAGLFVGSATFNLIEGREWTAAVGECATVSAAAPDGAGQQDAFLTCSASAERGRAAFALASAVGMLLAGLAVLIIAPTVVQRRRRLRPPGPGMAWAVDRTRTLARELGLRRVPVVLIGRPTQRDAFCFGRPGRYRIALPLKLTLHCGHPVLDTVLRHELSHLAHRDVGWSWLANAVWYLLAPMFLLPVALSLAADDLSVVPDYLWRAVVLACVTHVARRALLRSREHDADLRAARTGGPASVIAVLASLPQPARRTAFHRWIANHPDPATRLDVVRDPARATAVTVADGFTVAFLATLMLPLLGNLIVSAFLDNPAVTGLARAVVALFLAPLLGGTLGVGLWRQAVAGRPAHIAPAALGVFAGCVTGQAASFAGTALEGLARFGQPLPVVLSAALLAGATVVVAALGDVWSRTRARPRAIPPAVLATIVFGIAVWAAGLLTALVPAGWDSLTALVDLGESRVTAVVAVILAVVVARATARALPGTPLPRHAVATGLATGAAGAAVLAVLRSLTPSPAGITEQQNLLHTYAWVAGTVAATAATTLALTFGVLGRATALLAGPVAAATLGAGLLVINTLRGGDLTAGFATDILARALAAGFLLSLVAAPLALARPSTPRRGPSWLALIAVPAVVTTAISPVVALAMPDLPPPAGSAVDDGAWVVAEAVHDYKTRLAPDILLRRHNLETAMENIAADQNLGPEARADQARTHVLEPLRQLRDEAESYPPPNDAVRQAHHHCLTSLNLKIAGYTAFTVVWQTNNHTVLQPATHALRVSAQESDTWAHFVLTL